MKKQEDKNLKERTEFIDDLLNDIEDPLLWDNFGYCGYMESLIRGAAISDTEKSLYEKKLETMRMSEAESLAEYLREHANLKDPRDQFKRMVKNGVFNLK